jgi:hypothetical protein
VAEVTREKQTDAWHRRLHSGALEVMCRTQGIRMRVSGPDDWVWEMVELFEDRTGLAVQSDSRPPRRKRQIEGQLSMTELESGDNGGHDVPVQSKSG